ncbi:MAG: 4Fe-4S dicluster domain-containing protein, partial [Candidatus Caldarchaeum sp.]|nr:4Fe-4S dicluster domain-containing protein [Candidatus Caldarchaeum sp.]
MTRYAFVIDQTRCIGCHACTVACKMENHVPLGVYRTWVKYIERGEFPNTRRFYTVLRCNHCDNPPCVHICPTSALYLRKDGIVDFDNDRCIGCKACMQACPYDALYIDPETETAAKCHFCAHRVEQGLEPACVIVCPTGAIIWGDLDDGLSPVAKALGDKPAIARKPEQGTKPKLYYIGADQHALTPTAHRRQQTYMWSDRADGGEGSETLATEAETVYDVQHPKPWGNKISAYIFTKAIAAGLMFILSLLTLIFPTLPPQTHSLVPSLSLLFLAATGVLLVADLKQPFRFHYVIVKANLSSWLTRGTFIISAFGLLTILWMFTKNELLTVPTMLAAAAAAGYSGLLFGQCEGRDFWQSPSTLLHFIFTAPQAGSAALIILSPMLQFSAEAQAFLGLSLALSNILVGLT